MDLSKLKNKIILGAGLATILAIIITLSVIFAIHNNQNECKFVDVRPVPDADPEPVASADFTALASLSGYLRTGKHGRDKYLALKLTDCAKMSLDVFEWTPGYYSVDKIDVALERPAQWLSANSAPVSGGGWTTCNVKYTGIYFQPFEAYACDQTSEFICWDVDVTDRNLVLDHIKFEIDGQPNRIKRGEFSKPFKYCPKDPCCSTHS